MSIKSIFLFFLGCVLVLADTAHADTLVLKDGKVLSGDFKGGTETVIKFAVEGTLQEIPLENITSITFTPRQAQAPAAPAAAPAAATAENTAASSGSGTVPAGTKLMIKLDKAISTASHQAGSTITGVLDVDVVADGKTIVPKGSAVYGKVLESIGGRRVGNQKIVIQFTSLMVNNQMTPIATDPLGAEGGRGGAAKMVGAGALIGAAAGDAGTGALVGAGAALLAGGNHIQIPAGTIAEVPLKEALIVK